MIMDGFERGDELTLDDNSKYIVVDSFSLNEKKYLYLISEEDKKTTMVVELNGDEITEIDDKEELDNAYKILVERNKEEIDQYLKEINEN